MILRCSTEIISYVRVYSKNLLHPAELSEDERELIDYMERSYGFNELKALHEIAMKEIDDSENQSFSSAGSDKTMEDLSDEMTSSEVPDSESVSSFQTSNSVPSSPVKTPTPQSGESVLQRWFPSWTGWATQPAVTPPPDEATPTTTPTDVPSGEYFTPLGEYLTSSDSLDDEASQYDDANSENKNSDENSVSERTPRNSIDGSPGRERTLSVGEEFLDVLSDTVDNNSFMKRDTVFCQLSFTLKEGKFVMSKQNTAKDESFVIKPLFELDFSSFKIGLQFRPRNQSYKVNLELGSFLLGDMVTEGTEFPYLITPQYYSDPQSSSHFKASKTASFPATKARPACSRSTSATSGSFVDNSSYSASKYESSDNKPFFILNYENCASQSDEDHNLEIISQPLDLVYNPDAIEAAKNFFVSPLRIKSKHKQVFQNVPLTNLSRVAQKRYYMMMEQTKAQLKQNWNNLLLGGIRKRWNINLDISAPQIILPEHMKDRNAALVVVDLGRLTFCSANNDIPSREKMTTAEDVQSKAGNSMVSTLGGFVSRVIGYQEESSDGYSTPNTTFDDDDAYACADQDTSAEELLHSHMYDKYEIKLCDMQVLVAKIKDNWRYAYQRGTGSMHVIDKFSINVLFCRRIISIVPDDRPWPTATISSTMPNIMLHLNHDKVQTIVNIVSKLNCPMERDGDSFSDDPRASKNNDFTGSVGAENYMKSSETLNENIGSFRQKESSSNVHENTKLLVTQINIEKLFIELVSRGRSIAEVQIYGVNAIVQTRPHNYSASLTIHSLLVVDALQTFGPDFQLLVASHKHISMDCASGNLLDSDPCSPQSPSSPDPFVTPANSHRSTSPIMLNKALVDLITSGPGESTDGKKMPNLSTLGMPGYHDKDALISIEITFVSDRCPTQEGSGSLLLGSLQFNTVDIIANQETIVEIVGFIHQLTKIEGFTKISSTSDRYRSENHNEETLSDKHRTRFGEIDTEQPMNVEFLFDFNKIGLLLLRAVKSNGEFVGRKIATAIMSNAHIQTSLKQSGLCVTGSVGGFQVRDITPDANKHQNIISVGEDLFLDSQKDLVTQLSSSVYQSYAERNTQSEIKALGFSVKRPLTFSNYQSDSSEKLEIDVKMASVVYTHSVNFLYDITSCAEEFKLYVTRLAKGIRHAATEMAMGLVSKRIESFAVLPGYNNIGKASDVDPRHKFSHSRDTLNFPIPPPATVFDTSPSHSSTSDLAFRLKLNIILETPILVFPESNKSGSVIVAQLGRISILNDENKNITSQNKFSSSCDNEDIFSFDECEDLKSEIDDSDDYIDKIARYKVGVKDMTLYSLDVDARKLRRKVPTVQGNFLTAASLYGCGSDCSAIVHSTSIQVEFALIHSPVLLPDHDSGMLIFTSESYSMSHDVLPQKARDSIEITGGVVSAVKLTITRNQYRQMMETMKNASHKNRKDLSNKASNLETISESYASNMSRKSSINQPKKSILINDLEMPSQAVSSSDVLVYGGFTVPRVEVCLLGDVNGCSQPLVNLILEEFEASYKDEKKKETLMEVNLKSLVLEDLQCSESRHKYLLKSVIPQHKCKESESEDNPVTRPNLHSYISTSCPLTEIDRFPNLKLSTSLPTRLEIAKPFFQAQQRPIVRQKSVRKVTSKPRGLAREASLIDILGDHRSSRSRSEKNRDRNCPCTPPSSPTRKFSSNTEQQENSSNLVHINIRNIDKNHPEFGSKYHCNDRLVDVDFNSLIAIVNIPSWVMILDFFTAKKRRGSSNIIPPDQEDSNIVDSTVESESCTDADVAEDSSEVNTVVEIRVVMLDLVLVRVDGNEGAEVAGASVRNVSVQSVGTGGDLTLTGKLGCVSVTDLTAQGHHYKTKFITCGDEALTFYLFKYGNPDVGMNRDSDMRLNIKGSSVMYIHTQRFVTELMHVIQQFGQLQFIVEKWRAARAGQTIQENVRGTRCSLSVSAASPVIVLPLCSEGSNKVLVAELGSLEISNKFMWTGSPGTISKVDRETLQDKLSGFTTSPRSESIRKQRSRSRSMGRARSRNADDSFVGARNPKCLLDVMKVDLTNMDIYAATSEINSSTSSIVGKFRPEKKRAPPPNESGTSSDQDVDNLSWYFPDIIFKCSGNPLLKDKCALTVQVERNLDSHISRRMPDVSVKGCLTEVYATINEENYKLIRGLLQYNLGEDLNDLHVQQSKLYHPHLPSHANIRHQSISEETHITLDIVFDLDNVTIEVINEDENNSLATVNLIKSRLNYQSNSNGGSDVDLVSQEIQLSDTRFQDCPVNKKSNVFTRILQPTPKNSVKNEGLLQVCIVVLYISYFCHFLVIYII